MQTLRYFHCRKLNGIISEVKTKVTSQTPCSGSHRPSPVNCASEPLGSVVERPHDFNRLWLFLYHRGGGLTENCTTRPYNSHTVKACLVLSHSQALVHTVQQRFISLISAKFCPVMTFGTGPVRAELSGDAKIFAPTDSDHLGFFIPLRSRSINRPLSSARVMAGTRLSRE